MPEANENNWYVVSVLHGPISDSELLALADNGRLNEDSLVTNLQRTGGQIVPARRIRQLATRLVPDDSIPWGMHSRYEFKGEILGETSLIDFQRKYFRKCPGHPDPTPQISTNMSRSALSSIAAERWYKDSNIVAARIAFPFEWIEDRNHNGYWFATAGKVVTVGGQNCEI